MDYTKFVLPLFDLLTKFINDETANKRFIIRETERQFKEIVADLNRPKTTESFDFKIGNDIFVRITLPQGLERSEYDAIVREVADKQLKKLAPSVSERIRYGYSLISYQLKLGKLGCNKPPFIGVRWL